MHREAAMPLRLYGHAAGQTDKAVVGAFAGGERRALRQRLAKRERHVIRFAAADAEANGTDPILFALEGGIDQIVSRLLAPDPGPAFVHDGRIRGATDRFHHRRMTMAKAAAGIASVDQTTAIFEMEIDPLTADDSKRCAVARVQAGS
jgi:hypothetical protein